MKILMTSDTYLPRIGGGEYHVHYLAKELRARGHDVTFFTNEPGSWEGDTQQPVIRIPYTGFGSLWPIFKRLWALSKDVDLLHAHYSYRLGFLTALVARLRGKPLMVTQHGLGLLPQVGGSAFYKLVFKTWRYWTMKWANLIISTSEDMSVVIRECGFDSKIVPISNGYDATLFTSLGSVSFHPPKLLTVRRLNPKNGVQFLIAALPLIREKHPDVHLTCIGDGPWKERMQELASTLKVSDCITFEGPLGHERLRDFYKDATIVVMPSTAESTSLTCIEAMAQERIVVASKVGGLIELIGRNQERGYLVNLTDSEHSNYDAPFSLPPERITALSDAICSALANKEESMKKAHEASLYAAKNFSWGTIAQRTIDEAYLPLTRHP